MKKQRTTADNKMTLPVFFWFAILSSPYSFI
jgi:hypothetical protein